MLVTVHLSCCPQAVVERSIETLDPEYQSVIGMAKGLSFRDVMLANLMYNCSSSKYPPVCQPVCLPVCLRPVCLISACRSRSCLSVCLIQTACLPVCLRPVCLIPACRSRSCLSVCLSNSDCLPAGLSKSCLPVYRSVLSVGRSNSCLPACRSVYVLSAGLIPVCLSSPCLSACLSHSKQRLMAYRA